MEYQLSGNIFFVPSNPFGPHGPTLDQVLTVRGGGEDDIASSIKPLSNFEDRPPKPNNNKENLIEKKEKFNQNRKFSAPTQKIAVVPQDEIFLFLPDIKDSSETKIKGYFSELVAIDLDVLKLFILTFEKRAAILLNSVPASSTKP